MAIDIGDLHGQQPNHPERAKWRQRLLRYGAYQPTRGTVTSHNLVKSYNSSNALLINPRSTSSRAPTSNCRISRKRNHHSSLSDFGVSQGLQIVGCLLYIGQFGTGVSSFWPERGLLHAFCSCGALSRCLRKVKWDIGGNWISQLGWTSCGVDW